MKKLFIVMLFIMVSVSTACAFTVQTKGLVISKDYIDGIVSCSVLIDNETILINEAMIMVETGDLISIRIDINGPNRPIISIAYKIIDPGTSPVDDTPWNPGLIEPENNYPPGTKFPWD